MSPPYMPLYIADYLSATEHLDAAHSGAYLHLIMHYWQKGKLPHEDKFLARIARMTDRQWVVAKPTLKAFFTEDWGHNRINSELAHAQEKAEARAIAGSRGGISKALNYKKPDIAKAIDLPQQTPSKIPSKPLPSSSGLVSTEASASVERVAAPKAKRAKARIQISPEAQPSDADKRAASEAGLSPEQFRAQWRKFRDHHLAKGTLMADWAAAWRTWLGNIGQFQRTTTGPANGTERISVQTAARNLSDRIASGQVKFGPVPPPYMPGPDSGGSGGVAPRLLSQGGSGRPGDLRGSGSSGFVELPGSGGNAGDGPQVGPAWSLQVVANRA